MISRQEAAELLDCTSQTVTNWVEKGFIKGHTIGRALMIDRDSIEQHFDTAKEVAQLEQCLIDRKRELQEELKKIDTSLEEFRKSPIHSQPGEWREVLRATIFAAIRLGRDVLSERELKVLEYYSSNKSVSEIADEMVLPRQRIREIAVKALNKLSGRLNLKDLYEQQEAMKAETEKLKKKVEYLGEIAGKYQSKQDLINSYSMMEQYDNECSKEVSLLKQKVVDLPLSVRTKNVLFANDLLTLGDVVSQNEADISKAKNLGRKSFDELKTYITDLGFSFGMYAKGIIEADLQKWLEKRQ
jgi:excisionase family DNA binding protein